MSEKPLYLIKITFIFRVFIMEYPKTDQFLEITNTKKYYA